MHAYILNFLLICWNRQD